MDEPTIPAESETNSVTPAISIWRDVGALDDIPRLRARTVTFHGEDIAIFRTRTDQVFALFDRCPHKQGRLSQGIVHGESVTCPLHGWVIALADGQAAAPDEGCARRVPVRLHAGRLLLELPA
ncbi:MAG TPA: nitrite reductase small subunit NirD [Acetobacteraceae bacterium]|nr:nitrite reductase small subunit NirD [Acetobacteraceae bacterium]